MIPVAQPKTRGNRRFWIALLLLCAIGGAAAVRRIAELESAGLPGSSEFATLDAHFTMKARLTLFHVIPSLLFVLLIPLQFVSALRQRHPSLHRWTGRIIVCLGMVIGITALRLSAHPVGGLVEATATIGFGCCFLFALGKAWWHIRNRRVELHRRWATRMVAIALGVAATRPIMGIFFATRSLTGLAPEQFFGVAMWLGFASTVLAGEAWIRHSSEQLAS